MPLSEHEQRILEQIERDFYHDDPRSARRISATTLPRYLSRNCRAAALGFVAGLILLLVSLATVPVLGIVGFLVMTVSAVSLARNLRRYGRLGLEVLGASTPVGRLRHAVEEWRDRLGRRGDTTD